MPETLEFDPAGALDRCQSCGVLERLDRHTCRSEDVVRFAEERRRGAITPANARTSLVTPTLEGANG